GCLGANALHAHQHPVPFLFDQRRESEQLQQILAHQQVGIERAGLADRRQAGGGALRDMDNIPNAAHIDQDMVHRAVQDDAGDAPDHAAPRIAAVRRPALCKWWAWQIATASASAASGPANATPGSCTRTIWA